MSEPMSEEGLRLLGHYISPVCGLPMETHPEWQEMAAEIRRLREELNRINTARYDKWDDVEAQARREQMEKDCDIAVEHECKRDYGLCDCRSEIAKEIRKAAER